MFQEEAEVLWNRVAGPACYRLGLTCHPGYTDARPGQFVMLRGSDPADPLLPRPFSICRLVEQDGAVAGIEILYKVVGEGTRKLARLAPGERLSLLGPLGKGFAPPPATVRSLLVAGGIGVAPMVFLARDLAAGGVDPQTVEVLLGGRTRDDLLCREDFETLGISVRTTTDDGSEGEHGLVTAPLERALRAATPPGIVYACGPLPMLRGVARLARAGGVACQVSIETVMACGMGACLGCAVEDGRTDARYRHACIDGPVFDAEALKF